MVEPPDRGLAKSQSRSITICVPPSHTHTHTHTHIEHGYPLNQLSSSIVIASHMVNITLVFE